MGVGVMGTLECGSVRWWVGVVGAAVKHRRRRRAGLGGVGSVTRGESGLRGQGEWVVLGMGLWGVAGSPG